MFFFKLFTKILLNIVYVTCYLFPQGYISHRLQEENQQIAEVTTANISFQLVCIIILCTSVK